MNNQGGGGEGRLRRAETRPMHILPFSAASGLSISLYIYMCVCVGVGLHNLYSTYYIVHHSTPVTPETCNGPSSCNCATLHRCNKAGPSRPVPGHEPHPLPCQAKKKTTKKPASCRKLFIGNTRYRGYVDWPKTVHMERLIDCRIDLTN